MPRIADRNKTAAPPVGKRPRPLQGDVLIVRARDDDAWERESGERHRGKTRRTGRIRRGFGIAWRDEQRGTHAPRSARACPMRDQGAGRAVGDENRVGCGENRILEPRDPVGASGTFPIVLIHAAPAGVRRLPTTLPMSGS